MNNEMEHPEQVGAVGYLGSRDSSLQKLPYNFNVFFGLRQDLNRCSCVRSPGPSLSTALPPSSSFWCNSQLLSLPKQYHFVCWRKTEKIRLYPPRTGHWSKICWWCKKQRIIFEDNILEEQIALITKVKIINPHLETLGWAHRHTTREHGFLIC